TPTPLQEASAPAGQPPATGTPPSPSAPRSSQGTSTVVVAATGMTTAFPADAHPCWQTAGSDGGSCTTCCDSGGCHTDCQRGEEHVQQTGTPRPWNAGSFHKVDS